MANHDYDLFVIGAGSGGVRAARIAAGLRRQGGHRRGVSRRRHLRDPRLRAEEAAGLCQPLRRRLRGRGAASAGRVRRRRRFDWPTLIADKDKEIARLEGVYATALEQGRRRAHRRRAPTLVGPQHGAARAIRHARSPPSKILIATGGRPVLAELARRSSMPSPPTRRSTCERLPKRIVDRRRRLHRHGVRRHLRRPRRRDDARLPRRQDPARLRRGPARPPDRRSCASAASTCAATPTSPRIEKAGAGLHRDI